MSKIVESMEIKDPSTCVWVNGTTTQRFDLSSKKFSHRDGSETDEYHPLFFSMNIPDSISYSIMHGSGDFGNDTRTSNDSINAFKNGNDIVVFVRIAPKTQLFDFRDPKCFEQVFGKGNADLQRAFDHKEVYYAFNTAVKNDQKDKEPIEFRIAQLMLVYNFSKKNKYKSTGENAVNVTFFTDQTFIDILEERNSVPQLLAAKNWKVIYDDFISFFNKTISDAQIGTTKSGVKFWQRGETRGRVLPLTLTSEQKDLVNIYFKLLDMYAKSKSLIPSERKEILRKNMSGATRTGFMDLCQGVLYAVIKKHFKGYYCPEYIGASARNVGERSPTIAIFSNDLIEDTRAYPTYDVKQVYEELKKSSSGNITYNAMLRAVHDKCEHLGKKKAEDEQKKKELHDEYIKQLSDKKYIWFKDGKLDDKLVAKLEQVKKMCNEPSSPMNGKFTLQFGDSYLRLMQKFDAAKAIDKHSMFDKGLSGQLKAFIGVASYKSREDQFMHGKIGATPFFDTDIVRAKAAYADKLKKQRYDLSRLNVSVQQVDALKIFMNKALFK